MPISGLMYQGKPIQKKKAAAVLRSVCSTFFSRFCSGIRTSTVGWASVVARKPTAITTLAISSERLEMAEERVVDCDCMSASDTGARAAVSANREAIRGAHELACDPVFERRVTRVAYDSQIRLGPSFVWVPVVDSVDVGDTQVSGAIGFEGRIQRFLDV